MRLGARARAGALPDARRFPVPATARPTATGAVSPTRDTKESECLRACQPARAAAEWQARAHASCPFLQASMSAVQPSFSVVSTFALLRPILEQRAGACLVAKPAREHLSGIAIVIGLVHLRPRNEQRVSA
eukprot:6197077-Pleurochrysis_carterae.AAC.3